MTQIEDLYNKNRRRYVNLMSSILRGDRALGEDVVQEAFCRAVQYQDSFDIKRGKLTTWFNRILFNSLRDVQAQSRNQPMPNNYDYSAEDLFAELELSDDVELSHLVEKHIAEVKNEEHKRILTLFFMNGYTSSEISQIEHKVSVSNVTTVVGRFRLSLMADG